jgi:hypothetical protein
MKLTKAELKQLIKEEMDSVLANNEEEINEEEAVFAPNHYCIHHGGVNVDGQIQEAKAVAHDWSDEHGKVMSYDMQLTDGTILENVNADDIFVTKATLEGSHMGHGAKKPAKRHVDKKEKEDK